MTLLLAYVLVVQSPEFQDTNWKEVTAHTRLLLPEGEREFLDPLFSGDLVVEYPRESEGKLVFLSKYGVGSIGFRTRDRSLSHIRLELEPVPYSTVEYEPSRARERSLEISRGLRPYFEEWRVITTRVGPEDIYVQCSPLVGKVQSAENINFTYRKSDGRLFWVVASVTFDYSRTHDKVVAKESAIAQAWQAYYRWKPFPSGRLADTKLVLSTYTHSFVEGSGSELTVDDFTMSKNFVAVPIYVIVVASSRSSKTIQTIVVDAVSGKVKTILEASAIGGGVPVKDKIVGRDEIELTIKDTKRMALRDKALEPLESLPADWRTVPTSTATDSYAARLDPADKLWLAGNDGWYCYWLSEDAKRAAIAAAITGPKFGTPKTG
jgi:hypothetical protein